MRIVRGTLSGVLVLSMFAAAAAEPKKDDQKPAPTKSAVFYIPGDAKAIGKQTEELPAHIPTTEFSSGRDYVIRKGANVKLIFGPGNCYVEAEARVSLHAWSGTVVVKKGGVLTEVDAMIGERLRICYEKGAILPKKLDKSIVVEEYDTITLKPLPAFTLRGVVRERGRTRAKVTIHAYTPNGRFIGDATTDRTGAFALRAIKPVGRLVADLGERWSQHPAWAADLDFRRRVNVLRGWESEIREGLWDKDADIPIVRSVRTELTMSAPTVLIGHERRVETLLFSLDASLLITVSEAARPCVWDVKTGKLLRRFALHGRALEALDPSGKILLALSGESVRLWDVKTGHQIRELTGIPKHVRCVAMSPNGRTLALGREDGSIDLRDVTANKTAIQIKAHKKGVNALLFSRDGHMLLSTGHTPFRRYDYDSSTCDSVRAWDPATGRAVRIFAVEAITLVQSADGELFAGDGGVTKIEKVSGGLNISGDDYLYIWNGFTGQCIAKVPGSGETLVFTPDNRFLLTKFGRGLQIWEAATGQEVLTCPLPQREIATFTVAPDGGTLAVGGADGRVFVYDVRPSGLYIPEQRNFSDAEWAKLWDDLAADKAARAYRSLWTLQSQPARAVTLLRHRLRPARDEEPQRSPLSAEELQASRAIHLLEEIASPAARQLLETVSKGTSTAARTREAKAALKRLTN